MTSKPLFSPQVLSALHTSQIIGLRVGAQPHRFIGVWVVVVHQRVFVRSWNNKPQGWYQAFRQEPFGVIQVAGRALPVRARKTHGERLLDAIDLAYREKYPTPGSRHYVVGFARASRRATTLELIPS